MLQYLRSDADAAIDALSQWTEGEVIAEAVPAPNDDVWARLALVSLLTETGMRKGTFGQWSDYSPKYILDKGWGLDKNFEIFSFRAYSLIKDLTRTARSKKDDALLRLCGRWYAMGTSFAVRFRSAAREGLQSIADRDLNDMPEVALVIGSYWESLDGPFVPIAQAPPPAVTGCSVVHFEGPDGCVYSPNRNALIGVEQLNPTREALWGFKRAIELDPAMPEPHLRLGRLLHLLNLNVDAREQLQRALQDAIEQDLRFVTYMAGLFLGELEEHEQRWSDAVKHIRVAVAAAPTSHIANVALGEALLKSGDRGGWDEARRMFDDEDQAHPKKLDPWFYYRFAQYWRLASDLRDMRQTVRKAR
jgi:tetratricopeptide (TPR) repeat protein